MKTFYIPHKGELFVGSADQARLGAREFVLHHVKHDISIRGIMSKVCDFSDFKSRQPQSLNEFDAKVEDTEIDSSNIPLFRYSLSIRNEPDGAPVGVGRLTITSGMAAENPGRYPLTLDAENTLSHLEVVVGAFSGNSIDMRKDRR